MTLILPKKTDLDKARAIERKMQIDEGLVLAKSVDELRRMRLDLERNFEEYRVTESKKIQSEIDKLIEKKEILTRENIQAKQLQDELKKPLDNEWIEVRKEKDKLITERNELFLDRERFKTEVSEHEKEYIKISQNIEKTKQNEKDSEKAKNNSIYLESLAQKEYQQAKDEREKHLADYERKISQVNKRIEEYDVALKTIDIREKQVQEKESELIIREQRLASRIESFKNATQNIK